MNRVQNDQPEIKVLRVAVPLAQSAHDALRVSVRELIGFAQAYELARLARVQTERRGVAA